MFVSVKLYLCVYIGKLCLCLKTAATSTKMTVRRMLWLRRSWSLNWKKWADVYTIIPFDSDTKCRKPPIVTRQHVFPLNRQYVNSILTAVFHSCHRQAWLNEKFSPELLENKSEVVECVMEQLTHMVNSTGNASFSAGCMFRIIHEMSPDIMIHDCN